jgi:hypothetical protein
MAEAAGLEPAHGLVNNQVPYQLGYASSIWWLEAESNRRPHPYEGCTLPSELSSPPIADCRFRIADLISHFFNPQSSVLDPQSTIRNGPRGSRTHYLSIKSRELILMSFRPE